jgi:hypothetical protein
VFFVRHANARTMCIRKANVRRRCLRVPLTMAADAVLFELEVRQLAAARIPFEGVGQHDALRNLQHR